MKEAKVPLILLFVFTLISCEKNTTPGVSTLSFTIVNLDSVDLTGEIKDDSGSAITSMGFYWGTSPGPTEKDNCSAIPGGTGFFTIRVGRLSLNKQYYFRSFATNVNGSQTGKVLPIKIELAPIRGTMLDSRNGKTYATIKIRQQTWMAENLNFLPSVISPWMGSETLAYYYVYDYDDNLAYEAKMTPNYKTYGVLYNWTAALTACPQGWHLPTDAEWKILTDYLASSGGALLKEAGTTHWANPNQGANNATGLTVLPGGYLRADDNFYGLSTDAYFWSATEFDQSSVYDRYLYNNSDGVFKFHTSKSSGLSIRCLLDH